MIPCALSRLQIIPLNFLENHDEQRFASTFYAGDAQRVVPSLVVSAFFSTGPFMIYFGQELGEPGMDAEGFSGLDGRTTIFDYWSLATIRRWLKNGTCRGALTPQQKSLRALYRRILTLANSEAALREGSFFDLMYVNLENLGLNPHRHFAFLRHKDDETIVIVANFGNSDDDVDLIIPRHAFMSLDLPEGIDPKARNLLEGGSEAKTFASTEPFRVHVPAHNAAVWKISSDRIKPLRPLPSETKTKSEAKKK